MHETFWSLVTNLPHLEFELFLTLVQDIVIGLVLWPLVKRTLGKRFIQDAHREIDREHGYVHES